MPSTEGRQYGQLLASQVPKRCPNVSQEREAALAELFRRRMINAY